MVKCLTESDLRNAITDLIKSDCMQVLVEQYLEIDKECALIGFSDGEHVFIPGYLHLKQLAHGIHKGVAVAGELLPNSDMQPVIDQYESFVKATHFVGLFDIDFFVCQGTCYFGEMNMRIGASGDAYLKSGINMPAMMVAYYMNQLSTAERKMVTDRSNFVNERMAVMDWSSGYMTYKELECLLQSECGFFYSADDPCPLKKFNNKLIIYRVIKLLRKIWRKNGCK